MARLAAYWGDFDQRGAREDDRRRPQMWRDLSGFAYLQKNGGGKGTRWFTFTSRTKAVTWLPECRSSRSGRKCSRMMIIIRMRERADTRVPGEEHLEAGINKTD